MCSNPLRLTATGIIILAVLLSVLPVWGARPYKAYMINRYGSWEIVCESYVVQESGRLWEILRRKGCIAQDDFPLFVSILKRLNPHIKDLNTIRPGQKILIPLKQMAAREGSPDVGPRYITIPIIPDVLHASYKVRSGECLSKIVAARLGVRWDQIPRSYFQTLKRLNPAIKDMDLIYPGQTIRIPELTAREPSAAIPGPAAPKADLPVRTTTREEVRARPASVSPRPASRSSGEADGLRRGGRAMVTPPKPSIPSPAETAPPRQDIPLWREVIAKTVTQIDGKLLASGQYFFPAKGQDDQSLDLSAFPVIVLEDGRRLLLETGEGLPQDLEGVLRSFWKDLIIVHTDPGEAYAVVLDKVFRTIFGGKVRQILDLPVLDDGIRVTLRGDWIFVQDDKKGVRSYHCITLIEDPQERTPAPVVECLAGENIRVVDILARGGRVNKTHSSGENAPREYPVFTIDGSGQEPFVSGLVRAIGYSYSPRVPLSFRYAGFQIQTIVNLIHGGNGLDVVVDFGTFYGEAKPAIEAGGLKVLSIKPDDDLLTVAKLILELTGIPYTENPVFFAANRKLSKTTSLTIPGLLVSHANEKRALLTVAPLDPRICDFLRDKRIRLFKIKEWT